MSTVPYRFWRMPLGCITPKASDKDVEVQQVSVRYKRGEDAKPTSIIDGFNVDFLAIRGTTQTCKLPLDAKKSVEDLQKLLADKQTIARIKFNNPVLRVYSMMRGSESLTGISMTADNFEVTSTEKPEVDDLIDFE